MRKITLDQRIEHLSGNSTFQPHQQALLNNIRTHTCHLDTGASKDDEPPRVYIIGLWQRFRHPEIITVGLPEQSAKALITDMKDLVKLGQPPAVGQPIGHPCGHYPVRLEPIQEKAWIQTYLPMAAWFYAGEAFPVLQLFWSDPAHN